MTFHQKLIDNHAQSEPIMVHVPVNLIETVSLQLTRRVLGFSNRTSVNRPIALIEHLEGVSVDQRHQSVIVDHDVRFIDVADYIIAVVDCVHRYCDVDGNGTEVFVGVVREVSFSPPRVEALNYRLHISCIVH